MQDSVTADLPRPPQPHQRFEETELERRGVRLELEAPVTGAVSLGACIAVGFGDGTVRFFRPDQPHTVTQAHQGVVLCMAADGDHIVTGGDDGRFLRISPDGSIIELASFGTKWVDCVAASPDHYACSSGRTAHVWSKGQPQAILLEHVSTVGGIAFDAKGKRLAVAHYGGVTLWERRERRWKSSKLVWKGFHGAVTFSPDGKYVVTAMQEKALHGWRLRDKGDLAVAGYPAKIKSFAWIGDTPHLATSGADEAICWPFDGTHGPLDRSPVCVAHGGKQVATCVQALAKENAVFAGFRDGAVLLAELDESKDAIVLKGSKGAEVTAIAVTDTLSHLLVGDEKGHILWAPLRTKDKNAKSI